MFVRNDYAKTARNDIVCCSFFFFFKSVGFDRRRKFKLPTYSLTQILILGPTALPRMVTLQLRYCSNSMLRAVYNVWYQGITKSGVASLQQAHEHNNWVWYTVGKQGKSTDPLSEIINLSVTSHRPLLSLLARTT